tara:strand:+ start:470 stop:1012 length:543 start_codon:yes stop_codon:yes gene_type:complete
MYRKIINPISGKKVNVTGKLGKQILRKYLNYLNGGDKQMANIVGQLRATSAACASKVTELEKQLTQAKDALAEAKRKELEIAKQQAEKDDDATAFAEMNEDQFSNLEGKTKKLKRAALKFRDKSVAETKAKNKAMIHSWQLAATSAASIAKVEEERKKAEEKAIDLEDMVDQAAALGVLD